MSWSGPKSLQRRSKVGKRMVKSEYFATWKASVVMWSTSRMLLTLGKAPCKASKLKVELSLTQ